MTQNKKILTQLLQGNSDANVDFKALIGLLKKLGFQERINGSHHIFFRDGMEEIINLQPDGSKAKIYQVKQVRGLILKYKLGDGL